MTVDFSFANGFSLESRAWVYQSSRVFTNQEVGELDDSLIAFTRQWTAHNHQLKATGKVVFNRFIVLLVDETHTNASGCSIDKSVHFMKEIEKKFNVNLFDRLSLAFIVSDEIKVIPLAQVREKYLDGVIGEDSVFFNNTVQTLSDLKNSWMDISGNTWLASRMKKEAVKG